jgi:major vault protein
MDNQNVVLEPQPMLVVPKGHFCVVENPVIRTEDGSAKVDEYGQPQLFHGEREIRFPQQPFPLYPGEVLKGTVEQTKVIPAGQALVLRAVTNFVDVVEQDTGIRPDPSIAAWEPSAVTPGAPSAVDSKRANTKGQKPKGQMQERKKEDAEGEEAPSPSLELVRVARRTGDEWLVKGPGHYYPRIEEEVLELRSERRVAIGEALVMEALVYGVRSMVWVAGLFALFNYL